MSEMNSGDLVDNLHTNFPDSVNFWKEFGDVDDGIIMQMLPFGEFIMDIVHRKELKKLKPILDHIEWLIKNGDEEIGLAMTTGLLEYLMNCQPKRVNFTAICPF